MSSDTLNLSERKGLLWYRAHGPAVISAVGCPHRKMRVLLVRRGFIQITPKRNGWDSPLKYELTERGREALKP